MFEIIEIINKRIHDLAEVKRYKSITDSPPFLFIRMNHIYIHEYHKIAFCLQDPNYMILGKRYCFVAASIELGFVPNSVCQ